MKWFPDLDDIQKFYLSLNGFVVSQIVAGEIAVRFYNSLNDVWDCYKFQDKKWILQN